MAKTIVCFINVEKVLIDYPEFWRRELDLHVRKSIGGKDIVLKTGDIKTIELFEPERKGDACQLMIHSNHADKYLVLGRVDDEAWWNPLARNIFKEFVQGGNDFIYYRDEAGKVCVNRRIVCAAMRIDGVVVLGARHGSPLMNQAIDRAFDYDEERIIAAMNISREEGFIDQYDQFWDREQALTIAICAGQLRKRTHDREQLWSEDVW